MAPGRILAAFLTCFLISALNFFEPAFAQDGRDLPSNPASRQSGNQEVEIVELGGDGYIGFFVNKTPAASGIYSSTYAPSTGWSDLIRLSREGVKISPSDVRVMVTPQQEVLLFWIQAAGNAPICDNSMNCRELVSLRIEAQKIGEPVSRYTFSKGTVSLPEVFFDQRQTALALFSHWTKGKVSYLAALFDGKEWLANPAAVVQRATKHIANAVGIADVGNSLSQYVLSAGFDWKGQRFVKYRNYGLRERHSSKKSVTSPVLIDDIDSEVSGPWWKVRHSAMAQGGSLRLADTQWNPRIRWTAPVVAGKPYLIEANVLHASNLTDRATYVISDEGRELAKVIVDQRRNSNSGSKKAVSWVGLGVPVRPRSKSLTIELSSPAVSSTYLAADAIRLTPLKDAGVCGNGELEAGEACDDGNRDESDLCSNKCKPVCKKPACPAPPPRCHREFEGAVDSNGCSSDLCDSKLICGDACGNGVKDADEACDDGNRVNGDSCNATCSYSCAVTKCAPPALGCFAVPDSTLDTNGCLKNPCGTTTCGPKCGDGIQQYGEECDRAGSNGTRCNPAGSSLCNYCSADCSIRTIAPDRCGDALVQVGEECDDGNDYSGDGCNKCRWEMGSECSAPGVCSPLKCGLGLGTKSRSLNQASLDFMAYSGTTPFQSYNNERIFFKGEVRKNDLLLEESIKNADQVASLCKPESAQGYFAADAFDATSRVVEVVIDGKPGDCHALLLSGVSRSVQWAIRTRNGAQISQVVLATDGNPTPIIDPKLVSPVIGLPSDRVIQYTYSNCPGRCLDIDSSAHTASLKKLVNPAIPLIARASNRILLDRNQSTNGFLLSSAAGGMMNRETPSQWKIQNAQVYIKPELINLVDGGNVRNWGGAIHYEPICTNGGMSCRWSVRISDPAVLSPEGALVKTFPTGDVKASKLPEGYQYVSRNPDYDPVMGGLVAVLYGQAKPFVPALIDTDSLTVKTIGGPISHLGVFDNTPCLPGQACAQPSFNRAFLITKSSSQAYIFSVKDSSRLYLGLYDLKDLSLKATKDWDAASVTGVAGRFQEGENAFTPQIKIDKSGKIIYMIVSTTVIDRATNSVKEKLTLLTFDAQTLEFVNQTPVSEARGILAIDEVRQRLITFRDDFRDSGDALIDVFDISDQRQPREMLSVRGANPVYFPETGVVSAYDYGSKNYRVANVKDGKQGLTALPCSTP